MTEESARSGLSGLSGESGRSGNSGESDRCVPPSSAIFERRRQEEAQRLQRKQGNVRGRVGRIGPNDGARHDSSQRDEERATLQFNTSEAGAVRSTARPSRGTRHAQTRSSSKSVYSISTESIYSEATEKMDNTRPARIARDVLTEVETEVDADSEEQDHPMQQAQHTLHGAQSRREDRERKQELDSIQKGLQKIEAAQMELKRREQELQRQQVLQTQRERQFVQQQLHASRQLESAKLRDLKKKEPHSAESNYESFPTNARHRKSSQEAQIRSGSGAGGRRASMSSHESGGRDVDLDEGQAMMQRRASLSGSEHSIDAELSDIARPIPRRASISASDRTGNGVGDSSHHASWPVFGPQRRPSLTDAPGFIAKGNRSLGDSGGLSDDFLAPEAATTLHMAGRTEMSVGDFKAAVASLDRALYLYKSQTDSGDASIADVHHDLGLAWIELKDYASAGTNLMAAQQIRKDCSDPVGAADSLKEIGTVHGRAGYSDRALECYEECFEVLRTELGEDNPKTAIACKDMGDAESALGKNREACEHYEMALAIMKLNVQSHPQDIIHLLQKLGKLKFKVGEYDDALEHLREFCQLRSDRNDEFNIHDADALYTISKIYRANGDIALSQEVSKEALNISRRQRRGSKYDETIEQERPITASSGGNTSHAVQKTKNVTSSKRFQHLVPFVQIFEEQHKRAIRRNSLRSVTIRIFYNSEKARDEVCEVLQDVGEMMSFLAEDAKKVLSNPNSTPAAEKDVLDHLLFDDTDVSIRTIDSAAPNSYGLSIDERLFWEAYVMAQDCNPQPWSGFDTAQRRNSDPDLQEKNFKAMRLVQEENTEEVPVVMQMDHDSSMNPQTLVVAYEREGQVQLATSEFYDRYH